MPFHRRENLRADLYIAVVFALGAVAFTCAFFVEPFRDPLGLLIVVTLAVTAEALAVKLHHDGRASISQAALVLAAVSFGPAGAAMTATAIGLTGWFCFSRRETQRLAFNFGQLNLGAFAAATLMLTFHERLVAVHPVLALATGVAAGACIYAIGSVAVAIVMSLTSHRPLIETYRSNFVWLWTHQIALGVIGGGLAFAYEVLGVVGVVVLAVPVIVSRYSMKQVLDKTKDNVLRLEKSNQQLQGAYVEIRSMTDELSSAYTGTLESLVAALDVRDQETKGHSVRVATHSLDIAKMLGIKDDQELATIYRGALMHDVGKIGVPDSILLKPGKLTEEEWEFMRRHSAMGYKILAQVPYLRPTAKIVLAHHERWDGDGYPRRLKAGDIPLGARIFALCDTYDAIISDRPYRDGQTPDAAFAEILRCAGSQFDPRVIEAFEVAFPEWKKEEVGAHKRPLYLPEWRKPQTGQGRAAS